MNVAPFRTVLTGRAALKIDVAPQIRGTGLSILPLDEGHMSCCRTLRALEREGGVRTDRGSVAAHRDRLCHL